MTRRITSATRYQSIRTMTRVITLWTPPILRSVNMLPTHIAKRNILKYITALMLLVMTLMSSIMDLTVMVDITSAKLMPKLMLKLMPKLLMMDTLKAILMVLSVMTRRTSSVTRSPSHRSTRSARRLCTLTVKKNTNKFITAAMWLVMTHMLNIMDLTVMGDMEGITRLCMDFRKILI